MLRPGPLDVSGLFAASFEALKRRFGLFVLLALLPSLVAIVLIGAGVALIVSSLVAAGSGARALSAGVIVGIVVLLLAVVATVLAQLKAQSMSTLAAYEVAQGQRPDVGGLFRRTAGFLPRMTAVILIFAAAAVAVYLLVFFLALSFAGALDGSSGGGAALLGGLLFLLILALIPVAIFLQVKLLYIVPVVTIEQAGGIDAIKRSWQLTRGAFWRTLGYYLVAGLAVTAIGYLISLVGQFALAPGLAGLNTSDPGQAMAALAMLGPAYFLLIVVQLAVQLVTQPFIYAYTTYMYVDQVRRSEAPAYPQGPYGGPQPGAWGGPEPGPWDSPQPGPYNGPQPGGHGGPYGGPQPGGYGTPPGAYGTPSAGPGQGGWPPAPPSQPPQGPGPQRF